MKSTLLILTVGMLLTGLQTFAQTESKTLEDKYKANGMEPAQMEVAGTNGNATPGITVTEGEQQTSTVPDPNQKIDYSTQVGDGKTILISRQEFDQLTPEKRQYMLQNHAVQIVETQTQKSDTPK